MSQDDPFSEIEQLVDQLTDFGPDLGGGTVPVDVLDAGDALEVTADLPGYDADDIDVQLEGGRRLTIAAEAETETEPDDEQFLRRERRRRSARRTITLPEPVDDEGTEAAYTSGVLAVRLPKRTAAEGTNIPVS